MNRKRLALYLAIVIYQLGAFVFTYMVDGHLDLLALLRYIPWFKYIAFFGFILIMADLAWYFIESRMNQQDQKGLKEENKELKAKLYDQQESSKKAGASKGA